MTRDGLYIICSPGGYYPYVRIGWCRRNDAFIDMFGARVIRRFGTNAELARLAVEGPTANTQLLSASAQEGVSVAMVTRWIACDPDKWKKECPVPEEFKTAEVV